MSARRPVNEGQQGPKRRSLVILATVAITAVCLRLYHLGPFGIQSGDERILSQLTLTNGTRLVVVAHRNESLIEAYSVRLYRIEPNGGTHTYYLAHEDSYWWDCTMVPSKNPGEIVIRADWQLAATYTPAEDAVRLADGRGPYHGETAKNGRVESLLARAKLKSR